MPAKSDPKTPSTPRLQGPHWNELTATLPCESTEAFAQWIDRELVEMETSLKYFATPQSVKKSLGR